MEARSRRVGGGFPGYDGPALPRAMRSSRGRGPPPSRTSSYGFFELLATVAGQILQEDSAGEEERGGENVKQKCAGEEEEEGEEEVTGAEGSESPEQDVQLGREPSSCFTSCLESLGEAIRTDEAQQQLREEEEEEQTGGKREEQRTKKNEEIAPDSVHSVWDKAFLSSQPPTHVLEADKKSNLDISFDSTHHLKTNERQQQQQLVCLLDKQMTSSVSDNDENSTAIKSDPDSSISTAIKQMEGPYDKTMMDTTDDTIGSQKKEFNAGEEAENNGKAPDDDEEEAVEEEDEEENGRGVVSGSEDNTHLTNGNDMDIDPSSVSALRHGLDFAFRKHLLMAFSDVTKVEPSAEMTQLHCGLKHDKTEILDSIGPKRFANRSRSQDDKKPWKRKDFAGKDLGDDVDRKGQFDVKKPMNVVLGKLEPGDVRSECNFLSELILGHARGRISSKKGSCGSSKQAFPNKMMAKSMKDSYAKGMRARKVVKMVKRNRVSTSRSKRKHTDIEAAADSDEVSAKKAYYNGLSYTRQRTSRGFIAKRNKTVDSASTPRPDHLDTSDLMNLGFECAGGEPPAAAAKLRSAKAASVASSPTARGCSAKLLKKAGEAHVKLNIKSFTVPELCVDLPENATVSSLKRTVMDAAMTLLGGGLRVRVLLQGKKVPDEGATLAQVGISRATKPDSLGFMLEPSPGPTSPTSISEDPLFVLSRAAGQPSPRFPAFGSPAVANGGDLGSRCPKTRPSKSNSEVIDGEAQSTPVGDYHAEGKGGGLPFAGPQDDGTKGCAATKPKSGAPGRISVSPHSTRVAAAGALAAIRAQSDAARRGSKTEPDTTDPVQPALPHEPPRSGAIIVHPSMNAGENVQGLALVPVRQKSHSLDVGKRRVRRPFSVIEVEALVHAVEKLGTGRWRDVKLQAFDQAKHRTYVDLKDKWKTLVHTARIAPHQRRGEPVPQELLERVTRAHTYWTAQAAKQQAELDY